MKVPEHCPACRQELTAKEPGFPLRCTHCGWHLMPLDEWNKLSAYSQGYALYMQAEWPTSELKGQKNPYPSGTQQWMWFQDGIERAMLDTQDGEE